MARKALEPTPLAEVVELDEQKGSELQNTAAALIGAQSEERDTLNQMIGQIQMTGAIAKLTTVVGLTKLAHIKETRMYKALAGKKGVDRNGLEIADVGTWEGFCLAIGTTRQKADEDILNLKAFGEEALEDLGSVGAGYRELRQFRKLPEDQKEALIEVAKAGDKESFVELAEEIISKHTKVKEQLTKERDDALADYSAQSELLAQKNKALDTTKEELVRAGRILKERTPKDELHALKVEIGGITAQITSLFQVQLKEALQTLAQYSETHGLSQRFYMTSLVFDMASQLDALREEYDLPEVLEEQLDFLSDEAMAQAEANIAAAKANTEV